MIKNIKKGSILLESLVGILIFATAFTAVITLMSVSFKIFSDANRGFVAARVAREGMEMGLSKYRNNIACLLGSSCPISVWSENLLGAWEVDITKAKNIDPNKKFAVYGAGKFICVVNNPPKDKGKFAPCTGGSDVLLPGNITRKLVITSIDSEKAFIDVIVEYDRRFGSRKSLKLSGVIFGLAE